MIKERKCKTWLFGMLFMLILVISISGCGRMPINTSSETVQSPREVNTDHNDTSQINVESEKEQKIDAELLALKGEIEVLNAVTYSGNLIDLAAQNHPVGNRNQDATWNGTIFYSLEGYKEEDGYHNKYSCTPMRRTLQTTDGRELFCDIYLNPDNDLPNKIVVLEYIDGGIEVTECYYTNDGKPNFTFRYTTDNYVTTYATPDKDGVRCLFDTDSMVTWRIIENGSTQNYAIGQKEAERLKSGWEANTIFLYDDMGDLHSQYDNAEKDMLNFAYTIYEAVLQKGADESGEERIKIQGRIVDDNQNPISGAIANLYTSDYGYGFYSTYSDSDGVYTVYVPCANNEFGIVCGGIEGLKSCPIRKVKTDGNENVIYLGDANLVTDQAGINTDIEIMPIDDADTVISGGTVNVREGMDNFDGEIIQTKNFGADLKVSLVLDAGVYTLEILIDGCEPTYRNVVVSSALQEPIKCCVIPKVEPNHFCIVSLWNDSDLEADAHAFSTDADGNVLHEISEGSNKLYTIMDLDCSSGNYYKYCIVDKDGTDSGKRLSQSCLMIYVYSSDGLVKVLYVPVDSEGVLWEAFEIIQNQIMCIQRYYKNVEDSGVWISEGNTQQNTAEPEFIPTIKCEWTDHPEKESYGLNTITAYDPNGNDLWSVSYEYSGGSAEPSSVYGEIGVCNGLYYYNEYRGQIAAFDVYTGEIVWKNPDFNDCTFYKEDCSFDENGNLTIDGLKYLSKNECNIIIDRDGNTIDGLFDEVSYGEVHMCGFNEYPPAYVLSATAVPLYSHNNEKIVLLQEPRFDSTAVSLPEDINYEYKYGCETAMGLGEDGEMHTWLLVTINNEPSGWVRMDSVHTYGSYKATHEEDAFIYEEPSCSSPVVAPFSSVIYVYGGFAYGPGEDGVMCRWIWGIAPDGKRGWVKTYNTFSG